MKTVQTPYTKDFYNAIVDASIKSAQIIVPLIMDIINPERVVDIGCGTGSWLAVFKKHGVREILGVDGDYVDPTMLQIDPENFQTHNLNHPFYCDRKFDLTISLEVAEHIQEENAEEFVNTLVRLSPVVLFSAAIPHQLGTNHVNCQWPEYWANLFLSKGYVAIDFLREKLLKNPNVEWWYAQNILIFVDEASLNQYPNLIHSFNLITPLPNRIVHPELYLIQHSLYQDLQNYWDPKFVPMGRALCFFCQVLKYKILSFWISLLDIKLGFSWLR